jgi:hypothetical protein
VIEVVVFGAELGEVADPGGAAVVPGLKVVCVVVRGWVVAAREFFVPELQCFFWLW